YIRNLPLYRALDSGDWETTKRLLNRHPDGPVPAATASLSPDGDTALHVAVLAGHEGIVERLATEVLPKGALMMKNKSSATALNYAAIGGVTGIADCLVRKAPELLRVPNQNGHIPVVVASLYGHREMVRSRIQTSLRPETDPRPGHRAPPVPVPADLDPVRVRIREDGDSEGPVRRHRTRHRRAHSGIDQAVPGHRVARGREPEGDLPVRDAPPPGEDLQPDLPDGRQEERHGHALGREPQQHPAPGGVPGPALPARPGHRGRPPDAEGATVVQRSGEHRAAEAEGDEEPVTRHAEDSVHQRTQRIGGRGREVDEGNGDVLHGGGGADRHHHVLCSVHTPRRVRPVHGAAHLPPPQLLHRLHRLRRRLALLVDVVDAHVPRDADVAVPGGGFPPVAADEADHRAVDSVLLDGDDDDDVWGGADDIFEGEVRLGFFSDHVAGQRSGDSVCAAAVSPARRHLLVDVWAGDL
ncbi:unnamed protein product, partial [Linum tenue]